MTLNVHLFLLLSGSLLVLTLAKIRSQLLKAVGEMLMEPPNLFNPFMENVVTPAISAAIKDSQVTCTLPLPFKIEDFMVCIGHIVQINGNNNGRNKIFFRSEGPHLFCVRTI